jgi:hypothetical protein
MTPVFNMMERDGNVLLSVYKHRFLTISQIQRLHFPSMQTAYRRTRLLRSEGLLSAFTIPNIEESVFSIARKGLLEVAGLLGVAYSELRWTEIRSKPRDYYFMRHFLAINDFRITLSVECEASDLKLLGFIPDYYGERTKSGTTAKYIKDVVCDVGADRNEVSHTPDGVFALAREGRAALLFLEIDRGTEGISDPDKGVLKAMRFYVNYLLEGKYQRYAAEFGRVAFRGFRALFVTTSETRVEHIRQAVSALPVPDKAKRFIWLSTFDKIERYGLFAPVWVSADFQDPRTYQVG